MSQEYNCLELNEINNILMNLWYSVAMVNHQEFPIKDSEEKLQSDDIRNHACMSVEHKDM